MEYSRERLDASARTFDRLVNACRSIDDHRSRLASGPPVSTAPGRELVAAAEKARQSFLAAMDDDFNSAGAIGYMFELIKTYNVMLDESPAAITTSREALDALWSALGLFDQILGLFREGLPRAVEDIPSDILSAVEERNNAKKSKDFKKADELRDRILAAGFLLEDTAGGVRVRRK
jgi:cysteinyl-tRNA synthetase